MHAQHLHIARLAMLEASLSAVLREAADDTAFDSPDQIIATLSSEGLDIQFLSHGMPVAGEGT